MNSEKALKTILLVEDEAIISIIAAKALKRFGYEVITVNTGEKAVELSSTNEAINLILMDINLGEGIDGTEAARQILAVRNIPIVFHTSHSEREMVEKVRGITRYGYVVKSSGDFVLQSSVEMAFEMFSSHEKVMDSEQRYSLLVDSIPDTSILLFDHELRYQVAGGEEISKSGFDKSLLVGKTLQEAYPPDVVEMFEPLFRKALKGEVFSFEMKYGEYVYNQQVMPVRNSKGEITSGMQIAYNITKRKFAEEELKTKNEELNSAMEEMEATNEELFATNEELIAASEDLLQKEKVILAEKIFTEALLESLPGFLYVYDDQNNLVRWNKKYEEITGYSAAELSHLTLSDLFDAEDGIKVKAAVKKVFTTGYGDVEALMRVKNGGKIFIYANGVRLTVDGKKYFTGVGMDISERKRMDEALLIGEKRFRALFQQAAVGIAMINSRTGEFVLVNRKYGDIVGYSVEEMTKINFQSITHPDDITADLNNMKRLISGEIRDFTMEKRYYHKDGSIVWVDLTVSPIWQPGDEPDYHIAIVIDITKRKVADNDIQLTNKLLSEFIAHSPIYTYIKEVSSTRSLVLQASDNFIEMIGIPGSEMIGKDMEELFPHEFAVKMTADDWDVVSKGEVLTLEEELNGRSYITIKSPIISEVKKLLAGYTIDITERKLAEDKVLKLLAEKEIILREVHHRIKNNMNTINSLLILQADTVSDPVAVKALDDAGSRVRSMMVLYDKLYQSVNFTKISISEYLPSLIDEIAANFSVGRSVKIEKTIDDFIIDAGRLQPLGIIINELITNIMKHAYPGKSDGLIKVTAACKDNHVVFEISDSGIGMPESIDFENSSGFGLQLVSMLTQQIEGSIKIERGKGTKFILEFDL